MSTDQTAPNSDHGSKCLQSVHDNLPKDHWSNMTLCQMGQMVKNSFIFVWRLSVTKSCPLYNLITIRDISTKLHTFVKHIEAICHAQET